MILPWHTAHWERLRAAREQGRLGHALLLAGPPGLGKEAFARRLAAALLCQAPDPGGDACGQCRGCQLLAAGSHPDFRLVSNEDKSVIGVDQVRALGQALALTAQFGGARVAVLSPAERLNVASANALLKTLEEPAADAYLILVAHQASALPATVRSRCQQLVFAAPAADAAQAWLHGQGVGQEAGALLAAAGGAPLAALALHAGADAAWRETLQGLLALCARRADPVSLAAAWQATATLRLQILWRVLAALARWKAGGAAPALLQEGERDGLRPWLQAVDWDALFTLLDRTGEALRMHAGVSPELLLDDLLIGWTRLARPPRRREAR